MWCCVNANLLNKCLIQNRTQKTYQILRIVNTITTTTKVVETGTTKGWNDQWY